MRIEKIWSCLSELETEYNHLINDVLNHLIQEIIDFDGFYDNGPQDISCDHLIKTLRETLGKDNAKSMETVAIEFCITNEYIIKDKSWNCIDHLSNNHSDLLTKNDEKYLKALNNSYLSIFKITSISSKSSFVLFDMLKKTLNLNFVTVSHKINSKSISKDDYIAVRLMKIEQKNKPDKYITSNSFLRLPDRIAKKAISSINIITSRMKTNNKNYGDNILVKKMWTKEILELWFFNLLKIKKS